MDKYLKMADVFDGSCSVPVATDDELYCGEIYVAGFSSRMLAINAAHAINSHDELVAEVERLRYENSILRTRLDNSEKINRELLIEQ